LGLKAVFSIFRYIFFRIPFWPLKNNKNYILM
jgi:hypothetical protein